MENPQFHEAFGFDVDSEGIKQRVIESLLAEQSELLDEWALYMSLQVKRRSVRNALILNEISRELASVDEQLRRLNGESASGEFEQS